MQIAWQEGPLPGAPVSLMPAFHERLREMLGHHRAWGTLELLERCRTDGFESWELPLWAAGGWETRA